MDKSARQKFLELSLESTRKSYYPQLKKQLETVRENERHLQMLLDSLPARISYVDKAERYVFVNSRYEKELGLNRHQIIGRRIRSILGDANYAKAKPHIDKALGGEHIHYEIPFALPDGCAQWLDITYVPDTDGEGCTQGFYVLAIDITGKKRAEEEKAKLEIQLQQALKFEAIGTLAGGIAHDFNNLLMGIQGRSSLIATELAPYHPHMEHLHAIEEYIQSAVTLTKQLLGFARGGKYEIKPIDLDELVRESAAMFGRTRKEIRINIRSEQEKIVVEADRGQIEQVLLNMYVNAWQAMPAGGDLFLQTGRTTLDEVFCGPHQIDPGRYAKLSVTDTGIGMSPAVSRRIFDPFFTTKDKSRGTGLGLASAYGIIKNHGGAITVYSEVGRGTTFNIYLPASDKAVLRAEPAARRLLQGSETILLVDDEAMIIDVGQAMLQRLGYRVLVCRGGQEAVEAVTAKGEAIDLVILDLIMPGMDGGKVFERIRAIRPRIPVILSSGYAINGQATEIMRQGCNGFLQKPFNISELSQKVRQVLDDSHG